MLHQLDRAKKAIRYRLRIHREMEGTRDYDCPLCGYRGRFAPFGSPPRYNCRCRRCGSKERHREFALALAQLNPPIHGDGLHFAPEAALSPLLKSRLATYRTADIQPGRAELVLNLEAIDLPDSSLDLIVANHVLEHVDDRKTLAEFHRVLRPDGRALLTFPIVEGWEDTYENPAVTSPHERTEHFGQWDHIRFFGRDVRGRIRDAGFSLSEYVTTPEQVYRYAVLRGSRVFIATKGAH